MYKFKDGRNYMGWKEFSVLNISTLILNGLPTQIAKIIVPIEKNKEGAVTEIANRWVPFCELVRVSF